MSDLSLEVSVHLQLLLLLDGCDCGLVVCRGHRKLLLLLESGEGSGLSTEWGAACRSASRHRGCRTGMRHIGGRPSDRFTRGDLAHLFPGSRRTLVALRRVLAAAVFHLLGDHAVLSLVCILFAGLDVVRNRMLLKREYI